MTFDIGIMAIEGVEGAETVDFGRALGEGSSVLDLALNRPLSRGSLLESDSPESNSPHPPPPPRAEGSGKPDTDNGIPSAKRKHSVTHIVTPNSCTPR